MKKYFFVAFATLLFLQTATSQTVTAILTNNGVAPISSFSSGQPAAMVFINTNISKHLEFSPDVAFNAKNGELWFTDFWLRYNWFDSTKKWIYTAGIDFPSFFGQPSTNSRGEKINQIVVYGTLQGKIKRALNKNLSLTMDYWYMFCTDMRYGVKGHYLNLFGEWNKNVGNKFLLTTNPNFFYLNYSDGVKGFVGSCNLTMSHKKSGLFIGVLGVMPVTSKQVSKNWNVSLGITKKLF